MNTKTDKFAMLDDVAFKIGVAALLGTDEKTPGLYSWMHDTIEAGMIGEHDNAGDVAEAMLIYRLQYLRRMRG